MQNRKIFDHIEAFTDYKSIDKIIKEYKLNGYKNLSKILADLIREDFTRFLKENKIETVLYVPVSEKVLKKEVSII